MRIIKAAHSSSMRPKGNWSGWGRSLHFTQRTSIALEDFDQPATCSINGKCKGKLLYKIANRFFCEGHKREAGRFSEWLSIGRIARDSAVRGGFRDRADAASKKHIPMTHPRKKIV